MNRIAIALAAVACAFGIRAAEPREVELVGDDFKIHSLKQVDPKKMTNAYQKYELGAEYGKLTLSFKARVKGLVLGDNKWNDARVILNFGDANGKNIRSEAVYFQKDVPTWKKSRQTFDIPLEAKTVECLPALHLCKAGSFDVEELSLKLTKGPRPKPKAKAGTKTSPSAKPVK